MGVIFCAGANADHGVLRLRFACAVADPDGAAVSYHRHGELSYPLTWTLASLLFILYYKRGGWLNRCKAAKGLE